MRNAQGYAVLSGPSGAVEEIDTFTCCHCNSIVHVRAGVKPDELGSWCTLCGKMHCAKQICQACVPFEKKMECMEAAYHARRSYGD